MPSGLALPHNQRLFGYSEQVAQVTQFCGTPPPERPTARALLTIEGPPGTGKSLFSVFIRKTAEENGFRVCHTCVAKVDKFSSYVPFRPIFYNLLLLAKSLCPSSDNNSHSSASSKELQGSCTTPDHEGLPGSLMSMLRSVFTAMKEDEKKIPLLSGLLPSLTVPDNEWTKPASAKAREELVKKLVISIARFVEEIVNVMVVVENLEWIDALSASLIRSIINRCPRIRVVLLTQSLNECDPVFHRYASREPTSPESVFSFHSAFSVPQHSKTVQLQLGKMPLENMEELIAWSSVLGKKDADGMEVDFEIRGVDKKLTNFVETKSGSIPLAISYVGAYLNAMDYMIVRPDGVLALKETVSASVLADVHVSSFISWSFDRLPETARKSLQIASLISENRFAVAMLSELSQHVDGVAITEDEVIGLLASEHNLSFLIKLGSGKLREFEEEQYFSFRDPAVIPIIQCTIPPSSVSKLHLLIAQYYEKHNGTIAQIARHYMKTNPDDRSLDAKKATYLEILAATQLKGSNLAETIQTLQTLDEMMNVNPALKSKMDQDGTRSSSLYYALGSCLIKSGQNLEGERHLRTALYYCGFKFPEHGAGVKKMVVQQAWVQQKNYHNLVSLNSTTPTPSPSPNTDRGLRRKVQLAIDCFGDLITAYFLLGKEMELLLISLWGLNACQQLGQATPYHAAFLAHAGNMLCFFHFHDIGHAYLHRSIAMNLPLVRPHPSPFYVLAFDKFANGDWVGSHADQLLAIQYSRSFGVVTNTLAYYFASGPLVLLMTLRGDIAIAPPESAGLLDELEKVGKQNGDDEARLWAVFLKLLRVILLREDGCVPFADAWIPSNRIACLLRDMERNPASHKGDMNELTALGLLAAIDVRTGSNSSAFANIAKLKPLSKCLTNTSIIAYAGLSVSILALYEIIGSSRHMRMLASDRERLNSYAKDLESMCSILAPKYRFVNFSLYLAKAFPSFLTGQSVSRPGMTEKGISILLKGWKLLDVPPVASDTPSTVPSFSFSLFPQTSVEEPTPLSSTTSGSMDVTNSTTGLASPKGNLTVFNQIPLLKAHYLAILARYSSDLRPAEAKAWAFEARCALESVRLDPARFFDEEIEHTKASPCASHASTANTLFSTIKTGNLDSKPIGGLMARRRSSTGLGRRSSPLSTVL